MAGWQRARRKRDAVLGWVEVRHFDQWELLLARLWGGLFFLVGARAVSGCTRDGVLMGTLCFTPGCTGLPTFHPDGVMF